MDEEARPVSRSKSPVVIDSSTAMKDAKAAAAAPDAPTQDHEGDLESSNTSQRELDEVPEKPKGPPGFDMAVPDGGLAAWLQVASGFCLFFNTWGILNTFGVFQTYYTAGQLFTGESSSNIAWIGSIQAYLVLLMGIISGPLFDRGYLRLLLATGSFLVVFGFMMLSICKTFWQCLLAQGFCIGIGAGLLFTPAVSVLPQYWKKKLGMAIGIAASGSSLGGIIYPIVFYRLLSQIGFGWSVRVLGFIALGTLLVPNFFMKTRVKPPKARALADWTIFTDPPFLLFIVGCIVGFAGLYTFFFFVSPFAFETGILDASLSFYIVPVMNAASMFGRTLPNILADKIGPFNVLTPGALVCGVLIFGMMGAHNTGGIVVLALFFGFFSGVFIALPAVCIVALTQDKSKIGTRIGMGFGIIGFGCLIGGPGGGDLLTRYSGGVPNWNHLWIFGGVLCATSSVAFLGVRLIRTGLVVKAKA